MFEKSPFRMYSTLEHAAGEEAAEGEVRSDVNEVKSKLLSGGIVG